MRKKQQTTEHEVSHDHIISHHAPAALLRAEKNIIKLGDIYAGADLTNKRGKRPLRAPGNQGASSDIGETYCSVDVAVHRHIR